ncbi:MAG: outer membrane beta-barrel protein [Flavobacteriales bacterium]|nr:outer membrane beta-barrel protein [Flavobacteriales bacterium]
MKKTSCILLGLISLAFVATAQESKFYFGIGGGVDLYRYDFTEDPVDDLEHDYAQINETSYVKIDGYSIGARINVGPTKKIRFSTGIYFSQKGYKLEYTWDDDYTGDATVPVESVVEINYLSIPLRFNYRLIGKNAFHISPSLGVVAAVNVSEEELSIMADGSEISSSNISNLTNSDISDVLFNAEFSLVIGMNLSSIIFISIEPYVAKSFIDLDKNVIEGTGINYGGIVGLNFRIL